MTWRSHDSAVSHYIPSRTDAGLRLHLRARGDDPARAPVLFVHGATYASRLYDIPHPGASWLGAAARGGLAAYALDIRGYGKSRSPSTEAATQPFARADKAIHDIDDAVDWIRARHGADRVSVLGGSWGSITTGLYTATIGAAKVRRLVLYAPIFAEANKGWLSLLRSPDDPASFNPALGAFRLVTEAETRARWDDEIPAGAEWRSERVFQALVQSSFSDDPAAGGLSPPAFRAPNGTLVDLWEAFNGRPLYDPAAISCPVMLIRGGTDKTSTRSDAMALFDKLTRAADRQYVEIANGAHFVSAERRAPMVFSAVNAFLTSPKP